MPRVPPIPSKATRCFAALSLAALATFAHAQTEDTASSDAKASAAQSQKLSTADQQFIQDAGTAGATEIAASKLALTRSSDRQVKEFAQRMIEDHAKLARNLDVIAKRHGITSPPSADSSVTGSLQNLQGAEFDKAYIEKVALAAHQKAVELFGKESEK